MAHAPAYERAIGISTIALLRFSRCIHAQLRVGA